MARCFQRSPGTGHRTPGTGHRTPGTELLTLLLLFAACQRADEQPDTAKNPAAAPISVTAERRGNLQIVGADTLSDSARVLGLFPEPDGAAVAFIFADPAKGISSGLGILDSGKGSAQLIWPDSVANVRWPAAHRLSWTASSTRGGVHAVVDVHNAELQHIEEEHAVPQLAEPSASSGYSDASTRARATAYIDSIRLQPTGVPTQGTLRYTVTRLVPAPSDSLVAVYVTALGRDGSGRMNPAWYAMDLRSGAVAPIDSLTGRVDALAETTAAWIDESRFVYAKGLALYEAKIRPR